MKTEKVLSILKVAGVGAVLLGAGAFAGSQMFPKTIESIKTVEVTKEVPVKVIEYKNVTQEVPVDKIIYQDNGKLDTVMKFIEDNYDEDMTVDYIVFETDAKVEAEAFIASNFKSLLKDNDFFEDGEALEDYRTSEVSIKKIQDAEVESYDVEDKDLTLSYEVKFRAKADSEDAEYFNFTISIPFEEGKLIEEDVEIELI